MSVAKDTATTFFAWIKMQLLHLFPGMEMLSPGMKIPSLEIKNEIKIRLKITITNFPGYIQHAVKASTCYQDQNASEGVSSPG